MPSREYYIALIVMAYVVAGLLQGCGSGAPEHHPPQVASTWTATYSGLNSMFSQMGYGNATTFKFVFDLTNDQFYFNMDLVVPGVNSSAPAFENLFSNSSNAWEMTKVGYCAPQDMDWKRVRYIYGFGWLADAVRQHEKVIEGMSCVVWTLEQSQMYNWSACLSAEGIPLEYTMIANPLEVGSTLAPFLSMVNLTATNISNIADPRDFQKSAPCKEWPPAPCAEGAVKPVQIFRMCERCFDSPADENAGDFIGMMSTICSAAVGGSFISGASHIVKYDMMVNSSFGPYQMFNYIPNKHQSVGSKGVGKLVGRSVMNNACSYFPGLDRCGQCTDNEAGDWFSFPTTGHCEAGKPLGTEGCTWNVTSYAMKNMSCVAPLVKDPCTVALAAAQGKADPSKSAEAIQNIMKELAVAMGPKSMGGCPDVSLSDQLIVQI